MQSIRRFFWSVVLFLVLGAGFYYPLTRHAVIYRSSLLILPKAHWTWKDTYLNLDKHPERWCTVVESSTLSDYFYKNHWTATVQSKMQCAAKSMTRGLWNKVKSGVKQGVSDGVDWVKRESPKHLESLKKKTEEGAKYLKKKTEQEIKRWQK